MGSKFLIIEHTMASTVGQDGTFNVDYPDGLDANDFSGGTDGFINSRSQNPIWQYSGQYEIAFGASNMTITLKANMSFISGETIYLHMDVGPLTIAVASDGVAAMQSVKINLGEPDAADADGAVASQAATAASGLATGINGALASGGVATFDVARNVVAAWTTAAVVTITGTDQFGKTLSESSASGTSLAGKKAFKTITGVSTSVDITGLTVGTGDVLGLPCVLDETTDVLAEVEDGATATAGTIVAADATTATATTGDVRGTYDPNSTPDGSTAFELLALVRDPAAKGVSQFTAS